MTSTILIAFNLTLALSSSIIIIIILQLVTVILKRIHHLLSTMYSVGNHLYIYSHILLSFRTFLAQASFGFMVTLCYCFSPLCVQLNVSSQFFVPYIGSLPTPDLTWMYSPGLDRCDEITMHMRYRLKDVVERG